MSIKTIHYKSHVDFTLMIDKRHTVDFGPLNIGCVTHRTRDDLPMEVQYSEALGYLVAVSTDGKTQ